MSGKSALRKNRFTSESSSQGSSLLFPVRPAGRALRPFGNQVVVEYADVGQVPVALGEIEAVTDHEPVRDLESDPAHGDVDLAPLRLGEQCHDLERGRFAGFESAHEIGVGDTRVDYVFEVETGPCSDDDV